MGWRITFDGTRRDVAPLDRLAEIAKDPTASMWEGGKVVDIGDLSPATFESIAALEDDSSWWLVYNFPGAKASRYYRVVTAAANYLGVEVPPEPTTTREAVELLNLIERTPDPSVGPSASTTPSSDGQSSDSDGPPPSLDESASTTS